MIDEIVVQVSVGGVVREVFGEEEVVDEVIDDVRCNVFFWALNSVVGRVCGGIWLAICCKIQQII